MAVEGDRDGPAVPLLEEEIGSCSSSCQVHPPRNHARDVHILSLAFLFVFSAYGAAQNLQSTVNTEEDLGTTSLGILYLSFTFFSVVASPVVRVLGSKFVLVLGTTGYFLFIASNLKPSWYTMVPASLYLGFTASIIWVGQGTYLTSAAFSHAEDCHLHEGTVIGNFNGEFWGVFANHQVIGNLFSLVLLHGGEEGDNLSRKNLLFTIFLCCTVIGIALMCFLSKRNDKESNPAPYSSFGSVLKYVVSPLLDKQMLLIIPLIVYSGLQQAFVCAEFTNKVVTPALGISGVGGAMAIYGAADAICSLAAGKLTSGFYSITLLVYGGASLHIIVILWLLLGYSLTSGVVGYIYPLLMSIFWGIGNGVFNTQLSALLGILYKHEKEAAFAQLKLWQSAAIALIFFLSPYLTLEAMLIGLLVTLCIALLAFFYATLRTDGS
ncbi:UNC93-like protein 3 isoform X2 [Curcuma longa]|uniref:UNC93-like protein 3 isoform X2 n=1 Tax=Curcuma longa TaxID=136217 RepID=UPI003D9F904E